MPQQIRTPLNAAGRKFAVVVSRYNEFVTARLLAGAVEALRRHGAADGDITEVWVPGAWELPPAARALVQSGRYDAILCLGAVIRGETTHHEHVAGQATRGLGQLAGECNIPIAFGLLTTDTLEQAIDRAGGKAGNKGTEAALAAIEMAGLLGQIRGSPGTAR